MNDRELEKEFVADHRNTTKALTSLLSQLEADEIVGVHSAAEELDRVAGPHIAFEEQWLYPLVGESRGEEFHRHLIDEHDEVVTALKEIRETDDIKAVSSEKKAEWQKHLQTGLDHVVTCGTLLSHLTVLDDVSRQQMLDKLRELRKTGGYWTEFASRKFAQTDH